MLIYLIFGVLILGVLLVLILHSYKPNAARSWVIAMISLVAAWLGSFVLRLYLPSEITLTHWYQGTAFAESLGLSIDYSNWLYMVAALSMAVAVTLTDTTRANVKTKPDAWVRVITITALNLISILAANPLTMAISWMLVDLFDIFSLLRLSNAAKLGTKIRSVFGIRILSTFMLVFATSVSWRIDPVQINYAQMTNASIYFLIAAGLRLGVLPLNLPLLDSPEMKHGSGILYRLLPAASALVLIGRFHEEFLLFNETLSSIVQMLTLIAAFYSATMWMTRENSFQGRPYWMVALSALAIQCVLNGHAGASRAWGLGLLLSGSLIFLFNPPIRRIRFLPMLGLLGFIGLPYTLAASGWEGLLPDRFNLTWLVMVVTHAFLVLGYFRFLIESQSTVTGLEKFARVTFPLGLVTLLQTILVLGVVGWPGVLTVGNLWGSLGSLAIVGLSLGLSRRFGFQTAAARISESMPLYRLGSLIVRFLRNFLSMAWLAKLVRSAFDRLCKFGNFFNRVFEGDGGILWSLVFIVVFSIVFLSIGIAR